MSTLITLAIGIAVGAAFSKQWIAAWEFVKTTQAYKTVVGWFTPTK